MREVCKYILLFLFQIHTILSFSAAIDSINTSNSIKDGDGDVLVSSGGLFALGFFSPGNSTNRYLGIWYNKIPNRTVVWVANRESPLPNRTGVLSVAEPGILSLLNEVNALIIWSTNASTAAAPNPVARLLDSGNFVVKNAGDGLENFLWQSFDHPSNTYLPGMRLGWDLVKGTEIYMSSWRSNEDPSPGEFTTHIDLSGYPQFLTTGGRGVRCRYGPWNGVYFSGSADLRSNEGIYRLHMEMSVDKVMYWENVVQPSVVARLMLDPEGNVGRWIWNDGTQLWKVYSSFPKDNCEFYNACGAYGSCSVGNSPPCGCLERFVPRDPERWRRADWSGGCVRRASLMCRGDVFLKYSGLKMPDSRNSTFINGRKSLADCEAECSRNCSCVAYARLNISGDGSGCLFYYGELLDMRAVAASGQDLYIRISSTEWGSKGRKRAILVASFASVAGIVLCLVVIGVVLFCNKRLKKQSRRKEGQFTASHGKEAELPFFNLSTILKATNHFSMANKLGEGGFGPVYRGMLEDGQEIAVKCLAKNSSQGVDQLKNELKLIARLQHRNLVRLFGGCIERAQNMLIYEYMPNNSLDSIIFDGSKSKLLDWEKRFNIITGIAKGLLYLHQDSRLRIIHRDLKASNILLDADMNPKISDFGLARSFVENETEAQTARVVGTYGYMSPEYAIDGVFSIKSDVFSFGVLVLEIVSGKRNRGFCLRDHDLNLLGHAWTLYIEGESSRLLDASLRCDSVDMDQVLRSIHVALLCVQKSPEDRPNMSSVVFMLGNEVSLAEAKEPGFFTERDLGIAHKCSSSNDANSENQITISLIQGR